MAGELYSPGSAPAEPVVVNQMVSSDKDQEIHWQRRLLPLMAGMIIALSIFFFIVTLGQLAFLQWNILHSPPIELGPLLSDELSGGEIEFEELYRLRRLELLAALESDIAEKRYYHNGVMIMSGLWLRYLGFLTGMILAMIGASFILGKMHEPEQEVEGKFSQLSMSLRTTSPGIILAVLGVILMFTTLVDKDEFELNNPNIYMSQTGIVSEADVGQEEERPRLPQLPSEEVATPIPSP